MKHKRLYIAIAAMLFVVACQLDYQDEVDMQQYCEQMKADGHWPKGYNCE